MELIDWDSSYSVGVKEMDNQHIKLFGLINNYHEAVEEGRAKEVLSRVLDDLYVYTQFHFTDEEALLTANSYPESEHQKSEHLEFVAKIAGFKFALESGYELAAAVELANFLKEWLMSHIMVSDMHYGKFLNSKGVK